MAVNATASILTAFAAKRLTLATLRTPKHVDARQRRLLFRHLQRIAATIPFYRAYAGKTLADWPIMDKSLSLEHFGELNAHGVSRADAWDAAEKGLAGTNTSARLGDLTVGTSSGTSGNRGLFLVSTRERHLWLGSILARTLPDFPFRRHKVAVMLATANELYETTRHSSRLAFAFYDLRKGIASHLSAMQAFDADTIVAPPKALRVLAELGAALAPTSIFAGGEVLDPLDAEAVHSAFGVRPRSLYQATEGFLGVACRFGNIHLNEDDMIFEREPVPGFADRFLPVITDLRRTSQAMVRYRLNDILVPLGSACPCGSPLQALAKVEGRADDVVRLPGVNSASVAIMPDAIRSVVLDSDRTITDFRVVQSGPSTVEFWVRSEHGTAAVYGTAIALQKLFTESGVCRDIEVRHVPFAPSEDADKLRRVVGLSGARKGP